MRPTWPGFSRPTETWKGLDIQKEPRDRKIGEHLKLSPALTIEDLKAALDRQKSYSKRRIGELLRASDALRVLIVPGAAVEDLHRQALADGMVPLTEQALQLARQRVISLSEVYRVRLL